MSSLALSRNLHQSYHMNRWEKDHSGYTRRDRRITGWVSKKLNSSQKSALLPDFILSNRHLRRIYLQSSNVLLYPAIQQSVQNFLQRDSIYVLQKLPKEMLGSGADGRVFAFSDKSGLALKICDPIPEEEGKKSEDRFERMEMCKSYREAKKLYEIYRSQFSSPNLLSVKGLGYVAEIDLWGIVYDRVEGESWYAIKTGSPFIHQLIPLAIRVMLGTASGLAVLDQAGWAHDDLHDHNIMVNSNGIPIVIDFPTSPNPDPLTTRQKFGEMFKKALSSAKWKLGTKDDDFLDVRQSLIALCNECNSDVSLEALGWNEIKSRIERLS